MFIHCICTQYLVGAPFALITVSIRRGMEVISLWHCWGGMESQVSLIAAFSSSALLGLVSLISDSLWGSGQASLLANQAHQHHGHWTSFWYLWQCGQVPSPAGKWNQHLHKDCQQKEAWSALKFPGRWLRWLWTSENTVDQHQQMTWQPKSSLTGNFTDFKQHGFCASPVFLQTLGPWFPNEMQNLLSSEKRTLDHWATVQFFFSTAQVRRFWRSLWFRSGLVALFLKTSECGDSWCTDSSFSPLLVKLSQVFESALLDSILKLAVIPVACAPFPTQILPSSQLCI